MEEFPIGRAVPMATSTAVTRPPAQGMSASAVAGIAVAAVIGGGVLLYAYNASRKNPDMSAAKAAYASLFSGYDRRRNARVNFPANRCSASPSEPPHTRCPLDYDNPAPDQPFSLANSGHGRPEVYLLQPGGTYTTTRDQADVIARQLGGRLATLHELESAQAAGAQWESWGWVYDENMNRIVAAWPMMELRKTAGSGLIGVNVNPSARYAHITVWGRKPGPDSMCTEASSVGCVRPFSSYGTGKWSQYDF